MGIILLKAANHMYDATVWAADKVHENVDMLNSERDEISTCRARWLFVKAFIYFVPCFTFGMISALLYIIGSLFT